MTVLTDQLSPHDRSEIRTKMHHCVVPQAGCELLCCVTPTCQFLIFRLFSAEIYRWTFFGRVKLILPATQSSKENKTQQPDIPIEELCFLALVSDGTWCSTHCKRLLVNQNLDFDRFWKIRRVFSCLNNIHIFHTVPPYRKCGSWWGNCDIQGQSGFLVVHTKQVWHFK
jgi:hypothetical protein